MGLNILKTKHKGLCFVGDIHGEFNSLQGLMKQIGLEDIVYVICGDVGFGFEKPQYYDNVFNKLEKTADKYNAEFIMGRGNHDDPSYFDGKTINRKYFKAVPDYTVIMTPSHNILWVGGAISIDRVWRKDILENNAKEYMKYHSCTLEEARKHIPQGYWPDEAPYYDGNALDELKEKGIQIDIVATHTAPSSVWPLTKGNLEYWSRFDQNLRDDNNNERAVMDTIWKKLRDDGHPLRQWFYGHYHDTHTEVVDGITFNLLDRWRDGRFGFKEVM